MDDKLAFIALSALLTDLYHALLNDSEDRALNTPIAEEYARRLRGTFSTKFPALLDAYKALAAVNSNPDHCRSDVADCTGHSSRVTQPGLRFLK